MGPLRLQWIGKWVNFPFKRYIELKHWDEISAQTWYPNVFTGIHFSRFRKYMMRNLRFFFRSFDFILQFLCTYFCFCNPEEISSILENYLSMRVFCILSWKYSSVQLSSYVMYSSFLMQHRWIILLFIVFMSFLFLSVGWIRKVLYPANQCKNSDMYMYGIWVKSGWLNANIYEALICIMTWECNKLVVLGKNHGFNSKSTFRSLNVKCSFSALWWKILQLHV